MSLQRESNIFQINRRSLSEGKKIIRDLVNDKLIEDPFHISVDNDYLNYLVQYFIALKIPKAILVNNTKETEAYVIHYKTFCEKIVKFSLKYHIALSSITRSKCAGSIYILATHCMELKLDKDSVARGCGCSKSTAKRFADEINKFMHSTTTPIMIRRRIKHIFHKYNIPENIDPLSQKRGRKKRINIIKTT